MNQNSKCKHEISYDWIQAWNWNIGFILLIHNKLKRWSILVEFRKVKPYQNFVDDERGKIQEEPINE